MKIDFHFEKSKPGQIQVYHRCQTAFQKRGIECRFYPNSVPSTRSDADLLVVHTGFLGDQPEKIKCPIIYEESADSAMPIAREVLSLPNVIRFFKKSLVRNDLINLPTRRVHTWLLEKESDWKERLFLTEVEIAKIHPGIHLGMFNNLQYWVERARKRKLDNSWANRPIDALFIGQTDYTICALKRHRLRFCEAMRAIHGLNIISVPQRSISYIDYLHLSDQAKIIVSPWGYGEICYRDFEALLDDCVLVKPRTDFVQTLDNTIREGDTYVPCQIDALDLEQVIHSILTSGLYQDPSLRHRNREKDLAWWDKEKIVDWWCRQLDFCL